jgi:import inner membrane translocase subunit TIM50
VAKLLPDQPDEVPEQLRRPTLVIALDDCLIHTTYTPDSGWRTQKRPGVDMLLQNLSQYYELVIFSDNYMMTMLPIVEKLDPNQFAHKLYRDSTLYKDGKNIKDLSRLNRPLEKVLMVEFKPEAYAMQPENTMPIKVWKGDTHDNFLYELIPLLERKLVVYDMLTPM